MGSVEKKIYLIKCLTVSWEEGKFFGILKRSVKAGGMLCSFIDFGAFSFTVLCILLNLKHQ